VAQFGVQVAEALDHAHTRGVLHRDIKPPNLILDPLGHIWITDFGLAKFDEGEDPSKSHDVVGTLRYMAPERFRGVSTRQCDVYALGATLYEMLTLRPAFRGKDQLQLIRQIENDPPVAPRAIDRKIPRDLETIVQKALAKSPGDRYESAGEMAGELRRFVENRPIKSRPIPLYQHVLRWCKREPGLAAASLTAAAMVLIVAIGSPLAAWTFRDQRNQIRSHLQQVKTSEAEAHKQLFQALYDRARAQRFSRREGQRFESLAAIERATRIGRELNLPPEAFESLRDEAIACMSLPDLRPIDRAISVPPGALWHALDPTMRLYAMRFRSGDIRVHGLADDREIARFRARGDRDISTFHFSPDGRYLATTHVPGDALTVWDLERRAIALEDPGPVSYGHSARFSLDGQWLALAHDNGEWLVYDLSTGHLVWRHRGPGPAQDLDFRPDGAQVAILY
jgi:hypothetical protein